MVGIEVVTRECEKSRVATDYSERLSGADTFFGCLRYEIQGIGSTARRKGSCR
jgi:hypothetical protein